MHVSFQKYIECKKKYMQLKTQIGGTKEWFDPNIGNNIFFLNYKIMTLMLHIQNKTYAFQLDHEAINHRQLLPFKNNSFNLDNLMESSEKNAIVVQLPKEYFQDPVKYRSHYPDSFTLQFINGDTSEFKLQHIDGHLGTNTINSGGAGAVYVYTNEQQLSIALKSFYYAGEAEDEVFIINQLKSQCPNIVKAIPMFLNRKYLIMDKFLFDICIIFKFDEIIEKMIKCNKVQIEPYQYNMIIMFGNNNSSISQMMIDNKFMITKEKQQSGSLN